MSFYTAPTTMRRPPPDLSCSFGLWQHLLEQLRERGHFGGRESGAFLLGQAAQEVRRVSQFVLYDDLDPHSLDRGIVHFDGRYYGALWERCRVASLMVVADVHTHPFGSEQSVSDRAHPMIASEGHIALIIPEFATGNVPMEEIGMYRYLGGRRWHTVPVAERATFLQLDSGGLV